MAKQQRKLSPLFTYSPASDPGYVNVRDASDGPLKSARWLCEYLWIIYQNHADEQFRTEFRSNFDQRFWEMYLTMTLIFSGYEVTCPNPGPDIGVIHRGRRIWFEATTPHKGAPTNPDRVPTPAGGMLEDVPEDKLVLRHLSAVSAKCSEQHKAWLARGIIAKEDAYIVAINTRELGFHDPKADPPIILQTAYGIGKPFFEIDRQTGTVVAKKYEQRSHISRTPTTLSTSSDKTAPSKQKAPVETGVFQDKQYAFLSGLVCSHVDAANCAGEMGSDFQVASNPNAEVLLPDDIRLRGNHYEGRRQGSEIQVVRKFRS
ncbi:hypothetical protein [Bradyrhizobium betae]|uniref:Uncharacterized protein n=1 Tax=Bradyrhizobium betae TaxID=244734 RepID=A0A5P6NYT1_9BRAD|nr:hypothetical protein [Bradyrhizobium betae]MCS3725776.1 hypothetical protein [Bradyrhizobium betae]QFI70968.1 hypothetical protein F8237_00420 [Bradyrhizobium betae]